MASQRRISFSHLATADLIVDAIYEGGSHKDVRDDPIAPLVGGGNQGGFRYLGRTSPLEIRHCVLYSDLGDLDWPDRLDPETGRFTYYGDNKTPGGGLHDTTRHGNAILRQMFDALSLWLSERPCLRTGRSAASSPGPICGKPRCVRFGTRARSPWRAT